MQMLKPISSRTLSVKLAILTEHGIIKKEIESASPPYSKYSLTEKGMDLVIAVKVLADWSRKWQDQSPDDR
jgi:DNA-binding HxlR family transcriptional regulator